MHPTKTRIVYCKDANRTGKYPDQSFDFLGYTFRPRKVKNKHNQRFVSFTPAVSKASLHSMREKIRGLHIRRWTHAALDDIARKINPILRGWIAYYGRYCPSALYPLYRHVNKTLVSWARRKYKRLKGSKTRTGVWLQSLARKNPGLLVHWQQNTIGAFN